mgnify:CR=1 FL=1
MARRSQSGVFLIAALFCLSACAETEREAALRRVEAACGTAEPDYGALYTAAYEGDLAAIDCLIADSDQLHLSDRIGASPSVSVRWRYVRWRETGERPADIFEIASLVPRWKLHNTLHTAHWRHARATEGTLRPGVLGEQGCFLRPPRMDEIWRAGIPRPGGDYCADAVLDAPDPRP